MLKRGVLSPGPLVIPKDIFRVESIAGQGTCCYVQTPRYRDNEVHLRTTPGRLAEFLHVRPQGAGAHLSRAAEPRRCLMLSLVSSRTGPENNHPFQKSVPADIFGKNKGSVLTPCPGVSSLGGIVGNGMSQAFRLPLQIWVSC